MAVSRIASSTIKSINGGAADFLRIDSEVGLTFSGIALLATDKATRTRTTTAARKHTTPSQRLKGRISLTDAEEVRLDRNLLRLKSELQSLGQAFDEWGRR